MRDENPIRLAVLHHSANVLTRRSSTTLSSVSPFLIRMAIRMNYRTVGNDNARKFSKKGASVKG